MKILEASYSKIISHLTSETMKQLTDVNVEADEIEQIMGIAQVDVGNGVYMTIKLTVDIITPKMMVAANKA